VIGWTYGNGRQLQRPLDLDYRPQAVHDPAAGGLSLGFGYDPVGSITELKNGAGTVVQAKYAYDALGRLTQTQDGATATPIETYGYDATGNRTSLTTAAGTSTYSYPADSHHLVAVGGEARGHDAAGNTTSIGGKAFTYNDANRMNAVKLGGAVAERYGYNHRGERVLRAPEGGNAQITVYDEAGQWLGNYSATGQAQQQAIWLDNYPVALINVAAAGVPELAYIQPDHLGTPRVVIDPVRDVAIWEWSNKSEVFGDQVPANDPDGDGVAFELALRFPGQQATDASGMFYNYQREYDPAVGRYSQSDPIGLAGGVSTYSYVGGRVLSSVDPLGLIAYVCVKGGTNVGISLPINFQGASSEQIRSVSQAIEKAWTGRFGKYQVTTIVTPIARYDEVSTNAVVLRNGVGESWVNRVFMNEGVWFTPGQLGETTFAHEAGHLMGLRDYGPGIMGRRINMNSVSEENIADVLKAGNDAIRMGCGCE